jgi:LysM repeat protein
MEYARRGVGPNPLTWQSVPKPAESLPQMRALGSGLAGTPLLVRPHRAGRAASRGVRTAPKANYTPSLRPYTVRKGDTLDSVAKKRGLSPAEVVKYNAKSLTVKSACAAGLQSASVHPPGNEPDPPLACPPSTAQLEPGQTILLPTFKLSEVRADAGQKPDSVLCSDNHPGPWRGPQRDKEILKGIAPSGPRSYPLRKGETVADVLKGRGVTWAECAALNPGVDLHKAKDGQVLKLPYGRYTQREKEVLSSVVPGPSLGLPALAGPSSSQLQLGLLLLLGVSAYGFYVKKAKEWADGQA